MSKTAPKRKTKPLAANSVIVHAGAAKQAIRLLRWWAIDGTDEPFYLEMMKQSRECARDLQQSVRRGEKR